MQHFFYPTLEAFLQEPKNRKHRWLLLIAEKTPFDHTKIQDAPFECYGGIFSQVIYDDQHLEEGLIAITLETTPILLDMRDSIDEKSFELSKVPTMLAFVDGLSTYIDHFLVDLFNNLNTKISLIGGGAGKLTLKQEPILFTPTSFTQDSALLIPLEQHLSMGVKHGWDFLEGPLVATSSNKTALYQLNYQDAFSFYKKVVETDSGRNFDDEAFFDLAKLYPLGIITVSGETIVRDPITHQGETLILVGDMPENSVVNILKGDPKHLIKAASHAASIAYASSQDNGCLDSTVIMIDCISRVLFLQKDFVKEIQAVQKELPSSHIIGILTLGEISNNGDTYINFYNKTCVVGSLC